MKDFQLIPYCAQTSCVECEHTLECKKFYEDHGRLPYLFYKPYIKTDIEYLLDKLDVEVPETSEVVVHCSDCVYYNKLNKCSMLAEKRNKNDYCSYAERKKNK